MGRRVGFYWIYLNAVLIQMQMTGDKEAKLSKSVVTAFIHEYNIKLRWVVPMGGCPDRLVPN